MSIKETSSIKKLLQAAIPSILVFVITLFFDPVYQLLAGIILPESVKEVKSLWLYPTSVFILFIILFLICRKIVLEKIERETPSETEIIKVIEKWSGIVDGIGTALPLIGAAVILFTVGLGKDFQDLFLSFAVPFEIKSLLILATAKLFESVFDEFEIQIQKKYDSNKVESGSQIPKEVKIEFINFDQQTLNDVNNTIAAWNETVRDMKDPVFESNLQKILRIIGKS